MATASVPLPETPLGAPDDPTVPIFLEMKKKHGLLFPGDLGRAVRAQSKARDLVAGVIPSHSVSVLVGDSGLGKSPLAFQLAMSVVFGTPFLGIPTRPGRVVYVDYENSLRDSYRLMEQQRRRLSLAAYPKEKFLF
jgi:ABC-type phosphonate transport system ATPase subunit